MSSDVRQCLSAETNLAIQAAQERDREPFMSEETARALLNGVMRDTLRWMQSQEELFT